MKIGAFEVIDPLPELNDPCVLAILRPWIDVNNVGTLILDSLEARFETEELARLARPGNFFDFTRYRPTLYLEGDIRHVKIPNTTLSYAKRKGGDDFIFMRLLEPHSSSEIYIDSILRLFRRLKVKRYCLIGSMYDAVPHTRPLIVSGGAIGSEAERDFRRSQAQPSDYQGPTTITILISQRGPQFGIQTNWFIVSLPQYVSLEEDYLGKVRLMEILNLLFNVPVDQSDFERAAEQIALTNQRVEKTPELKRLVPQLETLYEIRIKKREGDVMPKLSPDIEAILWKIIGKDFGKA
ncbi:MAG: hypothetical protein A2170_06005 [Deltaproteobacteria bacterium RBG_13_53_10]|nr:MAG: hypothetical protein A2170_06005 [Deltaproteobacteria bacterium RBG_13_53_10]